MKKRGMRREREKWWGVISNLIRGASVVTQGTSMAECGIGFLLIDVSSKVVIASNSIGRREDE